MANAPQVVESSEKGEAGSELSAPLVVDLDGTLVSTDVMIESCFILAKKSPLKFFRLALWLHDPAGLKQILAREAMRDLHTLPYRNKFLTHLRAEKQHGRKLVLATAADQAVARQVADEIGLFDAVYASDGTTNLSGDRKRDRLVKEFGLKGFDYAGNSTRDRSVGKVAHKTILVHPTASVRRVAKKEAELEIPFECEATSSKTYLQALRPSHWLKNALVFLPLIPTHRFYDVAMLDALVMFAVLSLCASSLYLLNDLVDLEEDRRDLRKRYRVLASGTLPVMHAVLLMPALLLIAIALSLGQPLVLLVIGAYCILMLVYCLELRSFVLWDALALATGYSLRVIAGSVAEQILVSRWLLSSVFLLFFGLALLKRYAELISHRSAGLTKGRVRGYNIEDSRRIAAYGCLSSYLGLLVFGFYLATHNHRYGRYDLMWLFYLLLGCWITHMWLTAGRGEIEGDPVSFVLSDRSSRILGMLMAVTVLAAT
jgi:4-hydroxybenzoate polyprenyltransferase